MGTLWSQERPPGEGQPTEQSGWRDMTRRLLTTLLLVGLLLGSSVLLIYISQSCGPRHDEPPVDPHLLDTYLASRDTSVDPCTDFFSYVCGKAKGTNHSFQALAEENKSQLRRILETSQSWHPGSGEEKAFQFYNSCMDMSAIEAAGAGPLRQVIEELGGWRISGNWTSLDFNRTLRLLMSQYGYFPFFRAYLGPHPSPQHEPVIQIDQPELDAVLRQEQEQKVYAQIMREYLTYLNSLGNLLGGDSSKVQQHAYMSISITSQLLHFLRPLGQQRAQGKLSQMVTIGQLQEMAPAIDWLSCLQATFPLMSLSPTQLVVVHDLDYLQNMSRLVDKQLAEHRDFLQSHMIFGLVGRLSPALDSRFQEAHRSLHQKLRELIGQPLMPTRPRWMMCVEETESFFEPMLAAMFVPEAFSLSTQSAATELFTTIKDVLMTHLRSLPWVDEETRRKAQDRVTQLQVQLGAPEWALKPALAGREYNDIHLGPSYLQSFLSCVRSRQARAVQSSLQPFPQHRWHTSPREVRAYYSVSDHAMVFPARLFQPPFFHPRYPRAVNWGAAGSIMARELLHLFDQLLLPGGCPACDSHVLHEARLCLEHLYAAVPLPTGTSFGGSHTFQENAADVGALAIALQAYNKSLLWHRGETALPQPDLSSHQLFFFSYAKVKCMELSTRESQDTHSPPALRVHGPLDNTPDFARHFSCPRGALLKSYRCQLW